MGAPGGRGLRAVSTMWRRKKTSVLAHICFGSYRFTKAVKTIGATWWPKSKLDSNYGLKIGGSCASGKVLLEPCLRSNLGFGFVLWFIAGEVYIKNFVTQKYVRSGEQPTSFENRRPRSKIAWKFQFKSMMTGERTFLFIGLLLNAGASPCNPSSGESTKYVLI